MAIIQECLDNSVNDTNHMQTNNKTKQTIQIRFVSTSILMNAKHEICWNIHNKDGICIPHLLEMQTAQKRNAWLDGQQLY